MLNINSVSSSAHAGGLASGASALSHTQLTFQNALSGLQNSSVRSRMVLRTSGPSSTLGSTQLKLGAAAQDLLRQQIVRDCRYHPAL